MMERKDYNELMAKIADGGKVNQKTHDELVEFAKARKAKRPPADAVLDEAGIKQAAVTKGAKKGEPKAKAKCDPSLHGSDEPCEKDSRSDGVCAAHYSRLVYRKDPEKAERVREASRRYAEKRRAAKKAAASAAA